ncbi:hypothetical protein PPYR_03759 [Photinus pyralis]|uniref:Uncharacterized protein n=1 Tax=Photinus pyralis TaxID=7054 RepID=A0A5N4AWD8_PHOPY|nr:hypothetical protein PPYR_03759 [Photinus pyralis]
MGKDQDIANRRLRIAANAANETTLEERDFASLVRAPLAAVITTIAAALVILNYRRKKRNRKYWVRPWVARRNARGIMNLVNNELLVEHPETFQNYLRMTSESFLKLLSKIEHYISKEDTVMRDCIPAKHKLMITLRYLASGETYRNLMYSTRVHESTIAQFIPEVCRVIYSTLVNDYIRVCFIILTYLLDPQINTNNKVPLEGLQRQSGNRPSAPAMQIRDEFAAYFNGVGAIEVQRNMI